jgi:hypothetical protein
MSPCMPHHTLRTWWGRVRRPARAHQVPLTQLQGQAQLVLRPVPQLGSQGLHNVRVGPATQVLHLAMVGAVGGSRYSKGYGAGCSGGGVARGRGGGGDAIQYDTSQFHKECATPYRCCTSRPFLNGAQTHSLPHRQTLWVRCMKHCGECNGFSGGRG